MLLEIAASTLTFIQPAGGASHFGLLVWTVVFTTRGGLDARRSATWLLTKLYVHRGLSKILLYIVSLLVYQIAYIVTITRVRSP
jgi:hypothetical protein